MKDVRKVRSMKTVGFSNEQNRILGVAKPLEELCDIPEMSGNLELMSSYSGEMVLDDEVEFLSKVKCFKEHVLDTYSTNC